MIVPPDSYGVVEEGIYRCSIIEPINYSFLKMLDLKSILLLDVERPNKALYKFLIQNGIQLYQLSNRKRAQDDDDDDDDDDEIKVDANMGTYGSGGGRADSEGKVYGEKEAKNRNHKPSSELSLGDEISVLDKEYKHYEKKTKFIHIDNSSSSRRDGWMIVKRQLLNSIFGIILNKRTYNILIIDSSDVMVPILRKIEKWNFTSLINEYRLYANKNKSYQVENFLDMVQVELVTKDEKVEDEVFSPMGSGESDLRSTHPSNAKSARKSSVSSVSSLNDDENLTKNKKIDIHNSISNLTTTHSGRLSFVNSFKSMKSNDEDSYDNSYKSQLHSVSDRFEECSSSPKIPNNLLVRKKTKSTLEKIDTHVSSFSISEVPASASEHKSLLSAELASGRSKDSRLNSALEKVDENEKYYHLFYKPLRIDKYGKDIKNVIKINLPAESELPDWFVLQRKLWVEEYKSLNGYE